MERILNACSKGLIEVRSSRKVARRTESENFTAKVDVLHRTVRDFLRAAKMQTFLHQWSSESLNTGLKICRAIVVLILECLQE